MDHKLKVALRHLHHDQHKLNRAEHEHDKDVKALHKDQRELKHDRKTGDKLHKELKKDHRVLEKDRKSLDKLQAAEEKELTPLQQQQALLEQQYADSFDPETGEGDPAILGQLDAVKQQEADLQAKYGTKIDAAKGKVEGARNEVDRDRSRIDDKRTEIKKDRREVKGDRHELKRDRHTISHFKHVVAHDKKKVEAARSVPNVVGGRVGKWIAEAQTILKKAGIPLSKMNARDIALIIKYESGGNPNATNGWDSNAAAGTPSIGLMQTIGPTFNSYKLPGHGNIRNPVDNIIAGVRYAISRYGSVSNVPGVRAVHAGGAYVGY